MPDEKPVRVTTGTTGGIKPLGPGPSRKDPVVAEEDHPEVAKPLTEESAKPQKLPVEKDGSVGAKWGHQREMRRVEDGEGHPRWRVEDGDPPDGFVVHVPPERGLEP